MRGAALCHAAAATVLPGIRPAQLRRIRREAMLFEQGREPGFVGVLRRGLLRKVRLSFDGRRTLLGLAHPGDIVGDLSGRSSEFSLEAATDAEICAFDGETVRRMMAEDRRFRMHMLQETGRRHERQLEMIWLRGALTSRERIMAFLVMAAEAMPAETLTDGSVVVAIELARKDWADLSNTTVESISRTLGQLSEQGLVETISPGRFRIRNLARLTRLAGLGPERRRGRMRNFAAAGPAEATSSLPRLTAVNAGGPTGPKLDSMLETTPLWRGADQGR